MRQAPLKTLPMKMREALIVRSMFPPEFGDETHAAKRIIISARRAARNERFDNEKLNSDRMPGRLELDEILDVVDALRRIRIPVLSFLCLPGLHSLH